MSLALISLTSKSVTTALFVSATEAPVRLIILLYYFTFYIR